jgi:hypothetical protein
MLVLMEDAAEGVMSVDVQLGELTRLGERCGQRSDGRAFAIP